MVHVDSEDGYARFLQARWAEGRTWVNVEHDVVFWPGALRELWACPEPWCAFGYSENDCFADQSRTMFPYLGCAKLGASLIAATSGVWAQKAGWLDCDGHLARTARDAGFDVHQHFPSVVNANPLLLPKEHLCR